MVKKFSLSISYNNNSNINKTQYLLSTYSLSDSLLSILHEWPHLILPILSRWICLLHMKKLRLRDAEQFARGQMSNRGRDRAHTHALKTLQETASRDTYPGRRLQNPPIQNFPSSWSFVNIPIPYWIIGLKCLCLSSSGKRKFTFYRDRKWNEDRHQGHPITLYSWRIQQVPNSEQALKKCLLWGS